MAAYISWKINGVTLPRIARVSSPRASVSTRRSTIEVPGRHGVVSPGLPTFAEPVLSITVESNGASQAEVEAAVALLRNLLAMPRIVLTRIAGGVEVSADANLVSISPDRHTPEIWDEMTAVLAIPGVFFSEAETVSTPVALTSGSAQLALLEGSSAPAQSVLRFAGPFTAVSASDVVSGSGISYSGPVALGANLFVRSSDLTAWLSSSPDAWSPAGTDVSAGVDFPAAGPLQLWPGVERADSAIQATNLLTNPNCESTSGTVEVRRNLSTNPRAATASNFGVSGGTGGTASVSPITSGLTGWPAGITTTVKAVWTVAASVVSGGIQHTAPVTAGTTVSLSAFVATDVAANLQIQYYWLDSGGASLSNGTGPQIAAAAATVARVYVAGLTVPAGAVSVRIQINRSVIFGVGSWQEMTAMLPEVSPVVLPYLDYAFSPDSDLTAASLAGTGGILTGLSAPGADDGGGGGVRRVVSSTRWAGTGARSIRIIPTGNDASPGAIIRTFAAGDVGKTYTVLATCHLEAPITGSQETAARRIHTRSPNDFSGPQAPNAAGDYPLRWTFTVTTAGQTLRLGGGGTAGSGDVWWDKIAIVDGVYTGPWWDGSNPPPGYTAEWVGAKDASASRLILWTPSTSRQIARLNVTATGAGASTAVAVRAGRAFF